jgi:predicted TIM-barrel fold metal-dependent hydrolase
MTTQTIPLPAAGAPAAPDARVAIVDTDIHHAIRRDEDLFPYLSPVYRERLERFGGTGAAFHWFNNGGIQGHRTDLPESALKGAAVCDVNCLIRDHLDRYSIDYGLLTGLSVYGASVWPDVDYGSALCSAFNDYTIEHWLAKDGRLRFAMAICTQDPVGAVREIERIGKHPQIVGVLMPTGAPKPFGNRFYDPIYAACQANRLTPTLHLGTEGLATVGAPTAAGWPSYYVESRLARPGVYQAHLASFIFQGTFDKFPRLTVAFLECGIGWLPSFLWQMDADWKALRYQTPWVRRLPSEYVQEHIRFNSQPLVEPPAAGILDPILEWIHAEKTLMFGSDFPHFDFDDPRQTFRSTAPDLRRRIFFENAAGLFDLDKVRTSV